MMEDTKMQKNQLKFKIRLKQVGNAASSQDRVVLGCAEGVENNRRENEQNPSSENPERQLVVYNPAVNGAGSTGNAPDPIGDQPSSLPRQHPFRNKTRRVMLSVEIFTVQCNECFKWRLIPTKEKYEEIREHITEQPFLCETAREWRSDVSCDDPPDITQDGSKLWAMDKPNIAQPPPGWQRLLRIRAEGGTKFADVYYVSPSGKRLRSMLEVKRYLEEHPEYQAEGVNLSKFSFQIPRPLRENYVRKRAAPAPQHDASDPGTPLAAKPISWASPDMLQPSCTGISGGSSIPERPPRRRRKSPPTQVCGADLVHNPKQVSPQEPQRL